MPWFNVKCQFVSFDCGWSVLVKYTPDDMTCWSRLTISSPSPIWPELVMGGAPDPGCLAARVATKQKYLKCCKLTYIVHHKT